MATKANQAAPITLTPQAPQSSSGKKVLIWGVVVLITTGVVGAVIMIYNKNKNNPPAPPIPPNNPPAEKPEPPAVSANTPAVSNNGKTIPFTNKTQGDAFRRWVNTMYPSYAKQIQLDPSGSYNNSYIKKAWSQYGDEYTKYTVSGAGSLMPGQNVYARVPFYLFTTPDFVGKNVVLTASLTPSGIPFGTYNAPSDVSGWSTVVATVKQSDGSYKKGTYYAPTDFISNQPTA